MSAPFQPSCHSLHPVPPPRKKRLHPAALAASIVLIGAVLAGAGYYGWNHYCAHQQRKEIEEQKAHALLEAKARKDAALLAEMEQKKKESAADLTPPEPPAPSSWTEETKAR